jgi:hypothetical protein
MPDEERYQSYLEDSRDLLEALDVDDETFKAKKQSLLETMKHRQT